MIRMILAATALLSAAAAMPQTAPRCDGQSVTMRVSRLTANGTMAGLAGAVEAQKSWYAAHGYKGDGFALAAAMDRGRPSAREFVTLHTRTGTAPDPKHDAGWDAFVAKYKANATIASETRFCLPKGAKLGG